MLFSYDICVYFQGIAPKLDFLTIFDQDVLTIIKNVVSPRIKRSFSIRLKSLSPYISSPGSDYQLEVCIHWQ